MRPTSWSCWPLITCRSSSVSLPHFSLTLPANCLQLPSTLSQFMCTLPTEVVNVLSAGQRARPRGGCPVDFPVCFIGTIHHITHRRTGAGERHRGGRSAQFDAEGRYCGVAAGSSCLRALHVSRARGGRRSRAEHRTGST